MLIEYQFNLTSDSQSGGARVYLLKMDDRDSAWHWIGDTEFGPFDTARDICQWLLGQLASDKARPLR